MKEILTHEYVLCLYGVVLWEISEFLQSKLSIREFLSQSARDIGNSMLWVGIVVIFDDEILAQYNHVAMIDYSQMPWWMYMVAGFAIDIFRTKFILKK